MLISSFYSTFQPRKPQVNARRINKEVRRVRLAYAVVVPVPQLVLRDGKRIIQKVVK